MTLLIGEKKMKFDLHQSKPLTDEEMRVCMKIESLLSHIEKHAPMFLQEDSLKGTKLKTNFFSTKELAFELTSPILKMEEVILTSEGDEKGVFAMMDEGSKRRSRTSKMSLVGL